MTAKGSDVIGASERFGMTLATCDEMVPQLLAVKYQPQAQMRTRPVADHASAASGRRSESHDRSGDQQTRSERRRLSGSLRGAPGCGEHETHSKFTGTSDRTVVCRQPGLATAASRLSGKRVMSAWQHESRCLSSDKQNNAVVTERPLAQLSCVRNYVPAARPGFH